LRRSVEERNVWDGVGVMGWGVVEGEKGAFVSSEIELEEGEVGLRICIV